MTIVKINGLPDGIETKIFHIKFKCPNCNRTYNFDQLDLPTGRDAVVPYHPNRRNPTKGCDGVGKIPFPLEEFVSRKTNKP